MRTNLIAAVALAVLSTLHVGALAQNTRPAQLQLTIVDEAGSPVANAVVTIYTIVGPRSVKADAKGAVVAADLPADMTQVWARTTGNLSGAEATTLKAGANTWTLAVHPTPPVAKSDSGS